MGKTGVGPPPKDKKSELILEHDFCLQIEVDIG